MSDLSPVGTGAGQRTLVSFSLGDQMVAIPTAFLREVLEPMPVTRVPGAGPLVPGVLNVRGSVVPLADLAIALNLPRGPESDRLRFMVTEVMLEGEPSVIVIMADAVHEVTTIAARDILPVPASMSAWPTEFIEGLYRTEGGFIILPDLVRIFSALALKPSTQRSEES